MAVRARKVSGALEKRALGLERQEGLMPRIVCDVYNKILGNHSEF